MKPEARMTKLIRISSFVIHSGFWFRHSDLREGTMGWGLLADALAVDGMANLGVAGLMGAMWLWERRTSRQREMQIDEAHARIMADRVGIDQLMAVVRQNAEAMSRLSAVQEQLLRELNRDTGG